VAATYIALAVLDGGVAGGIKVLPGGGKLVAQLAKIVDLAVERDHRRGRPVLHRLMSERGDVDDRQPTMCQPDERARRIPLA